MLQALGPFCAFMSSVTWALGSTGYSRLTLKYSAYSVNFSRAFMALPMFIVAALISAGGWHGVIAEYSAIRASNVGWFALAMLGSYGLGDVLFLWSTLSLGVPGALAIASIYPLWTALAGFLFQGEVLAGSQVGGLALTTVGIIVVILNGPKTSVGKSGRGLVLAFLASLFWAMHSFAVARGGHGLQMAVGNSVRMTLALVYCAGFGRFLFKEKRLLLPLFELRRSLWLFFIEAFGGSAFFLYGLSHSPLAIGSALSSLAPVLSVPVAWALKLEKFSFQRTLGVCLTVAGLWLLLYTSQSNA